MCHHRSNFSPFVSRLPVHAITLTLFFCSAHADTTINRCRTDSSVTYTDQSCPTQATSEQFSRQVAPPDDPAGAQRRYHADQQHLQQLVQQRKKEEKHQDHENRVISNQIKEAKRKEYQCKEWTLKRNAAIQRQSATNTKGRKRKKDQAQLAVLQADYKVDYYCGAN